MATAKRLPSGSWRVQVYSHLDKDGKKHKISFTAATKKEAELKAAEWQNGKRSLSKDDPTIQDALERFIKAKSGVLSPSTIRGYNNMLFRYGPINSIKISKLSNERYQLFISDLAQRVSPKTVANVHGLLMSAIRLYIPDKSFRVTLPKIQKVIKQAPTDKDIQLLFNTASNQLKLCIALAAFGSMRRGEISALKYGDIKDNTIYIHADMVKDSSGEWVYKPPKERDSTRVIILPDAIISLIGSGSGQDYIIKWTPDSITKRFIEHRNKCGLSIRFHDLRHYFASIGAVLQIPTNYLESFGGWKQGGKTMREIYQNNIQPMSELYALKMTEHFNDLISEGSHNSSHGNEKSP